MKTKSQGSPSSSLPPGTRVGEGMEVGIGRGWSGWWSSSEWVEVFPDGLRVFSSPPNLVDL